MTRRILLGAGISLAAAGFAAALVWWAKPSLAIPGELPAPTEHPGWITYRTEQFGFQLRYPSDWMLSQWPEGVSFSSHEAVNVGISFFAMPVEEFKAEIRRGRYEMPEALEGQPVTIAGVKGERFHSTSGNFEGVWKVESFLIPHGSSTYLLSGSSSNPARKALLQEDAALWRSVMATFELIERRPRDQVPFVDPAGRYSFEIPSSWRLAAGSGPLGSGVNFGRGTTHHVEFFSGATVDQFVSRHGIKELTEEKEWFAHRLRGRRGQWLDTETYLFPQPDGLVVIRVQRTNESADVIERLLDSVQLGGR